MENEDMKKGEVTREKGEGSKEKGEGRAEKKEEGGREEGGIRKNEE